MRKRLQTILSLDIGGTFTKIAICSQNVEQKKYNRIYDDVEQTKYIDQNYDVEQNKIIELTQSIEISNEGKFKTDRDDTWDTLWKKVLKYCNTNDIDINTFDSLAIAVPGFSDEKNMTLAGGCPNLPNLTKDSLKESLESVKFHKPVFMINDATAQMYFEHGFGILKNTCNALLITVGTGIGGGILINGKVYEGKNAGAGEFGHAALYFKGLTELQQCSCGKMNCIEKYASVSGLLRSVYSLYHSVSEKAEDVLEAFLKDNSFFSSVDLWLEALSALAGSLINIFNPECICFSGSVMKYKELLPLIQKKLKQYCFKTLSELVNIVLSSDNIYAGVKGSAVYALTKMNKAKKTSNID